MALSTVSLSTRFGANFAKETSATSTASVISSSSVTVFVVEINNTANSVNTYVQLFNHASPTVGTTDPHVILKAPASQKVAYQFSVGIAFGTALSVVAVTNAGTAGTSNPSSAVIVKAVYD